MTQDTGGSASRLVQELCDLVPDDLIKDFNEYALSVRPDSVECLLVLDREAQALITHAMCLAQDSSVQNEEEEEEEEVGEDRAVDENVQGEDNDASCENEDDNQVPDCWEYKLFEDIVASLLGNERRGWLVLYRGFEVGIPLVVCKDDFLLYLYLPQAIPPTACALELQQ